MIRPAKPAIDSVAVMPFQNQTGDPEFDYLADGMSDDLIGRLSEIGQLKVIARSSSVRFKGKEIDPKGVGRVLDVRSYLIGTIERTGQNLSIRVELVSVPDGSRLWSEQYTVEAATAQAIEGRMARRVAQALNLELNRSQDNRLTRTETASLQAYQLYLNGVQTRRKSLSPENVKKAAELFEQAIALDDRFVEAYVSLASAYRYLQSFSVDGIDKEALKQKMYRAIDKAMELDRSNYDVHLTLAGIHMNELDWAGAEKEFKDAIALNPNSDAAQQGYAGFLSTFERHDEALSRAKLGQSLDPLSVNRKVQIGRFLFLARRYDEAISYLSGIVHDEPKNGFAHYYMGASYAGKGQYIEALSEYEITSQIENSPPNVFYAFAAAHAGKRDLASAVIEQIRKKGDFSPAELAIAYIGLGDKEEAISLLQQAFEQNDLQLQYLRVDPHYDEIRSDPRFQDLLRRVGLSTSS
jgi:TolB-like protein/thioredoxin-like negative regulator of GroEL